MTNTTANYILQSMYHANQLKINAILHNVALNTKNIVKNPAPEPQLVIRNWIGYVARHAIYLL